jgi:CPA2 family monovalent cation:H+ antiporter-2
VEQFALPLRDVFAAFFFLNFGLSLDTSTFGGIVGPVAVAVVLTLVVNTLGGQLIAWQNKLTRAEGLNVSGMLQNRGEFVLILATLATAAGLDARLTPFAGLYVLSMSIIGPILAVNSERIGARLFPTKRREPTPERDRMRAEGIALVEAATAGLEPAQSELIDDAVATFLPDEPVETVPVETARPIDRVAEQAAQQSDEVGGRTRDPEY